MEVRPPSRLASNQVRAIAALSQGPGGHRLREETLFDRPAGNARILLAIERDGLDEDWIVGYSRLRASKASYRIVELTVGCVRRREGIGRRLVRHITDQVDLGEHSARREVLIDVEEQNFEAQLFLRACGFTAAVHDRWPDVYVFRYERCRVL